MPVTHHQGPWPEGHPLRRGFVAFVRRPEADAASALPDETEDDPIGMRMELLRRALARQRFTAPQEKSASDAPEGGDAANGADTPG